MKVRLTIEIEINPDYDLQAVLTDVNDLLYLDKDADSFKESPQIVVIEVIQPR